MPRPIADALAGTPSMSGQGTMGEENEPDALAAFGVGFAALDTEVYDPVFSGEALGGYRVDLPIPVPGVLLQPDRELGAAFFDEHAVALAATSPTIEIVRLRGVGHLIHDSRSHRGGVRRRGPPVPRHPRAGMICDPHHHLWEHPEKPYMMSQLRADTGSVDGVVKTVFVECGSSYRTAGPEAFRPVGETEFVVAADPDGFIAGIVGFADLTVPEIDDVLAAHVDAGRGRFRGIRHVNAFDPSPDVRASHTDPPEGLLGMAEFRRGVVRPRPRRAQLRRLDVPPAAARADGAGPGPSRRDRSSSTTSAVRSGSAPTPGAATRSWHRGGPR